MEFRFKDKESPRSYVTALSCHLHVSGCHHAVTMVTTENIIELSS